MTATSFRCRAAASVAAAALVLPLSVAAVAAVAPAIDRAAAGTFLVDRGWPPYAGQPYAYLAPYSSTASLDTAEATSTQAEGLVTISSEVGFGEGEAAGTGIVIGSDGLVVTNHHVVEGATSIEVTVVNTGRTYDAEVLGFNAKRDVAVLQLEEATGLATVSTDASRVLVGDDVTAVGDAGGDGGALTAADGTVTDDSHSITVSDEQTGEAHRLTELIEVDADIIPGDSGGALLSSSGQVVGMNVAASSGSAQITGYVIPIKRVLRIAARVVAGQDTASITLGYDAFLVGEEEFDAIHGRIVERGLEFWADPLHRQPGEINTNDGGRGLYWNDPNGHNLEILTVPYGGWQPADPG